MGTDVVRVLVADAAAIVRGIVSCVLDETPDVEVVGSAADGRLALARVQQLVPDLLVLDAELPGTDVLDELRQQWPGLPVIALSEPRGRNAAATIDALLRGATDAVLEPPLAGSVKESMHGIRTQLIPRIRALCPRGPVSGTVALHPGPGGGAQVAPEGDRSDVEVVVAGASTGGVHALDVLLRGLPADLPVPILVAQDLPRPFTRELAARLAATSALPVVEATEGLPLEPGLVVLARGDHHLGLRRTGPRVVATLDPSPAASAYRPSTDVLFGSAVDVHGEGVLGLVLTGMGQDGLRGAERVLAAGGQVVAQDQHTSVVWEMPGAVVEAGLAHAVVPLVGLADEIVARVAGTTRQAVASAGGVAW